MLLSADARKGLRDRAKENWTAIQQIEDAAKRLKRRVLLRRISGITTDVSSGFAPPYNGLSTRTPVASTQCKALKQPTFALPVLECRIEPHVLSKRWLQWKAGDDRVKLGVRSSEDSMSFELATENGDGIAIQHMGLDDGNGVHLVWGHGWGRTGADMLPLAESLGGFVSSSVVDFPGFGNSPAPPNTWGTADYADAIAKRIKMEPPCRRVWVGHSFGCRVGIQLAARYPGMFEGLILVAAAGLPRRRSIFEQLRFARRRYTFKAAKFFLKEGPRLEAMRNRLGSSDYRKAGELRPIFVRVVNEDLTSIAGLIQCPVLLIYGDQDTETPVEIGVRLNRIIQDSKLIVLDGFDHHSLLAEGRHQVAHHILRFLRGNEQ